MLPAMESENENLSTVYQMKVDMQARNNNAEVILHSHILVSNRGDLEEFVSENVGEQDLAEKKAVY